METLSVNPLNFRNNTFYHTLWMGYCGIKKQSFYIIRYEYVKPDAQNISYDVKGNGSIIL